MKSVPKIDYRGIAICYREWNNQYDVDGESKQFSKLKDACTHIDNILKVKFKNIPVFYERFGNDPTEAIATSVNEHGEVFVSFPDKKGKYGSRSKLSSSTKVFIDNPQNREKYAQIQAIRQELSLVADGYKKKVAEIASTMDRIGGERKGEEERDDIES